MRGLACGGEHAGAPLTPLFGANTVRGMTMQHEHGCARVRTFGSLLGMMLTLMPLSGCNSDDTGLTDSPPSPCDAPYEQDPPFESGELFQCEGTRKGRFDVEICTGLLCAGDWVPVQEFVPPGGSEPLIPDEQLNIEQMFGPLDGNPPPTGACCDPNNSLFTLESVLNTAMHDCAARSCREVHDQFVDMANGIRAIWETLPSDKLAEKIAKNAHERAFVSLEFFAKHLETPTGFSACEAGLFGDQAYLFPDPPDPGAGSLRSMKITQWECQGLSCESAGGGDPTTGGGSSTTTCTDNPNWFEGNAGPTVLGQGVPEEGVVTLTLGGADAEAQYSGVAVAYERLSDCPADSVCPFALTDLRFALHDVTFGPVTLQAPKVFLNRPAFGAQVGDDVTIGHENLSLRIESSLLFFGQPFLDGAMIPLYVRNKGNVEMTLSDGVLEIHNAGFDLFDDAVAKLVIAATFCDEA